MKEINFDEWEEITYEEYKDIGDEYVMWIMFHKGEKHLRGYYFKKIKLKK